MGFCHAVVAEVMVRCGDLCTELCRRQCVALVMEVDRWVVAFQDSWGRRKRGIAEGEAMPFVCGGRPLRRVNEFGSAEKIEMLGSQEEKLPLPLQGRAGADSTPVVILN